MVRATPHAVSLEDSDPAEPLSLQAETQDFFLYMRLLAQSTQTRQLTFEDLAPLTSTPRVAAKACAYPR